MCKKERTWIEWESRIYAPDWFIKWIDKMY